MKDWKVEQKENCIGIWMIVGILFTHSALLGMILGKITNIIELLKK